MVTWTKNADGGWELDYTVFDNSSPISIVHGRSVLARAYAEKINRR